MKLSKKISNRFKFELLAQIISAISGLFLTVFLARFLGADEYGLLFLTIAIFGVARLFSTLGIAKSAARYITEYKEKDFRQIPNIIRISFAINLVVATGVVTILIMSHGWIADILSEPELVDLLLLGIMFIPLVTLFEYTRTIFQGFEDIRTAASIKIIDKTLRLAFVVLLVLLGFEAIGALVGYIFAYLFAVSAGLGLLFKKYRTYQPQITEPGLAKRILSYNVPIAVTHSAHTLEHRVDTVLVGFFINPVAVAYYTIGKQIVQFIEIPMSALGFTLSPTYSAEKAKDNVETAAKIYETALSQSLLIYIPAVAGLILIAEPFVQIVFGEDYLGAIPVIQILAIYALLLAVTKLTGQGLDYLGRARGRAVIKIITAVLNVILNIIFIPWLGVVGAAYATVITFGIYTAFNIYIINQELQLQTRWLIKYSLYVFAITLVVVIVIYPTISYVSGILTLILVVLLGILVWAIQVYIFDLLESNILKDFLNG